MDAPIPGLGTLVNTVAVAAGALLGMGAGHRFSKRTRTIVTDCLGLVTLLMAALSARSVTSPALAADVGASAPVLIVLGSLVLGGILGAALRLEDRLEGLAGTVRDAVTSRARRTSPADDTGAPGSPVDAIDAGNAVGAGDARERFVEGWLSATLLFCVGPLTILGSINDGRGRGIDQLAVKSALDFFASIAFASTFGVGVVCSAVSVLVVQGALTVVGMLLGSVMPESQIMALTATGGLLLVGIAFRLLDVKNIRVGDLLPALLFAPLLTAAVAAFH